MAEEKKLTPEEEEALAKEALEASAERDIAVNATPEDADYHSQYTCPPGSLTACSNRAATGGDSSGEYRRYWYGRNNAVKASISSEG